ncbi:NAD kinase [Bifidobacterium tissieri]|uniref:NAD kinase n=1 Tax=Bifidobacterium tissieri TaxID=1630162 RepID=A0A261FFU7_9BIFI|nr:NAD kinase [Bifidobacterium tissieri]KAA8832093.1 NAD kinase [Bifidobacterium tissieri]KAA8832292.1 NAD kinase [Bifidobacterium tissieri]OZG57885.1 NAD(+) kinase [Bifidobacterium tissieri]
MPRQRNAVIVTHRQLATTGTEVKEVVEQLKSVGFDVTIVDNLEAPPFAAGEVQTFNPETEIVIVLGGDGTILRAAELVKGTDVPIVGINMGHVGFLAEFESFQTQDAIAKIAARDYSIDERVIAWVDVWVPGATEPMHDWALNDVTLERADRGKMVELSISVDDVEMSSFGCDGVIVSTPTGSTAYAFSAGGPIIWPNVDALQLVPLAAHALFSRPLVIGSKSSFTLDISEDSSSEGWICCDGRRQRNLPRGSRVVVRQSPNSLRLARLVGVPFTSRLVGKFDLPVMGWRESGKNRGSKESKEDKRR